MTTDLIQAQIEMFSRLVTRHTRSPSSVIPWSCPTPAFGGLSSATVATLGLNPSNREFVDGMGQELTGVDRRLPTLRSLQLYRWADASLFHIETILSECRDYFQRNPYKGWFDRLERLLLRLGVSYFRIHQSACHLDVVPFATARKWSALSARERKRLFAIGGDTLGMALRHSRVRMLILNGSSVIRAFEDLATVSWRRTVMSDWTLRRESGMGIRGTAFHGATDRVSGVDLGRRITVLGFNHNLQSSFGVTTATIDAIANWIASAGSEEMG